MADIGFVDIVQTYKRWPMNTWPRDEKYKILGTWNLANMNNGLEAFSMAPLTRALGWKRNEVAVFLADVRKEVKDKSIHAYWPVCVVHSLVNFLTNQP
jgi:hypothetical protein